MSFAPRKPPFNKYKNVPESDKAKAQFGLDLNLVVNKITLNPIGWCVVGMRSTLVSHKIAKKWYSILCKTNQSDKVSYHLNFCMYFRIGKDYADLSNADSYQELVFTIKSLISDIGDTRLLQTYIERMSKITFMNDSNPGDPRVFMAYISLYTDLTLIFKNGIANLQRSNEASNMGVNVVINPRNYSAFVNEYRKKKDSSDPISKEHCLPMSRTSDENITTCVEMLMNTTWTNIRVKQIGLSAIMGKNSSINKNLGDESRLSYAIFGRQKAEGVISYEQEVKE
jgi:hypothetical protein